MGLRRRLGALAVLAAVLASAGARAQTTISGPVTFGTGLSVSGGGTVSTAPMAAGTIKGNNTGSTANAQDLTPGQIGAMLCPPQVTVYASGSGTYTTPNCNGVTARVLEVDAIGGGGGGAGSGTSPGAATAGGGTTFGSSFLTANGGALGRTDGYASAGGSASGGDTNDTGGSGGIGVINASTVGGAGCTGPFGGGGPPGNYGLGGNAATAPGSGGAGDGPTPSSGGGGACGGRTRKLITSPAASYSYAIGAAGAAGTAGTGGVAGAAGFAGRITIVARWQ